MTAQYPAAPETEIDARCTCANDGNARRCPHHTQADYDASAETDANGLTEAEHTSLAIAVHDTDAAGCSCESVYSAVERIVAERVRVVEGERDAALRSKVALVAKVHRLQDQIARASMEPGQDRQKAVHAYAARAESAEAAHERLRAVAESIAYEHAATVDGEFGCCHDEDALRAGGRVAEFDGDEFEPIPADCPGQKTLARHLAALAGGGAR